MRLGKKRNLWLLLFACVLLLVAASIFFYQNKIKAPTQEEVNEAVAAKDWKQVVSLLNRTNLDLDEGENFYNLGQAYIALGNDQAAINALREADDRNYQRGETRFLVASLYAKAGQVERASHWLRDALDAGFTEMDRISSDPYLGKLPLPVQGDTVSTEEESFSGLDFLIGTWNTALGPNAGTGSVTFAQVIPGYMVTENWSGSAPGGASGVFLFDPATKEWSYSYVDGYGRTFDGTVRTGRQVVITGTMKYKDGVEVLRRVEIRSSSGIVDYAISESRDGGRTWDEEERRRLNVPSDAPRPNF